METQEKINLAKRNIHQAIEDYGAHSWQTAVLKDIDARFVDRLAEDNAYAKDELRSLFRKSPVWEEAMDAKASGRPKALSATYRLLRRNLAWRRSIFPPAITMPIPSMSISM